MTIAGQTFIVNQAEQAGGTFSIAPTSANYTRTGTAAWPSPRRQVAPGRLVSNATWMTITGAPVEAESGPSTYSVASCARRTSEETYVAR